jgi:aspartate racemase
MHRVAPAIEAAIDVPLLHIADATAGAVRAAGVQTVALLGTRFTMEHDFYRGRLAGHGLAVLVPDEPDRTTVHDVIYDELVQGVVSDTSRAAYLDVIDRMVDRGARGVIAGCTEIELLVRPEDVALPYFPTTRLHALAAVDAALDGEA